MPDEKPARIGLITGAGSGIGRATTVALSRAGFSLVLAGRRLKPLEESARLARDAAGTAASRGSSGAVDLPRFIPVAADISRPEEVLSLFARIEKEFGRLDLLFNNAGVGAPVVPLEEVEFEQWKTVVDVNLTGAFLCTQAAFRIMKSQRPRGGRIINNGSISAYSPRPLSAPYTATKHAVTGLTRAAALDGREFDIAVGQIDIGNAATEMTSYIGKGALQADGTSKVEPFMDVGLVADVVVRMATLPLEANIFSMTVMATKMPFVGRG